MMTKEELLIALSKFCAPNYPRNVFRERFFTDYSVRWLIDKYRSGEIESSGVFARLGEETGLYTIALAEGYDVNEIARAAKVSPRRVRKAIIQAFQRARKFHLVPIEYNEEAES